MPGTYTGEFILLRAPANGTHFKTRAEATVLKGDEVYLHPGHKVVFGNLTVAFPHNSPEGRPYITMETKK